MLTGLPGITSVKRHRKAAHLLAAAVAAIAVLGVAPSVSSADACNAGDFCINQHANFGGGLYHWGGNDGNLHNDLFWPSLVVTGDNGSSLRNRGVPGYPQYVLAYKDVSYGGPSFCVPPLESIWNLQQYPVGWDIDRGDAEPSAAEPDGTWNDDISSYRWVWSC
jgi:hypothetical protein